MKLKKAITLALALSMSAVMAFGVLAAPAVSQSQTENVSNKARRLDAPPANWKALNDKALSSGMVRAINPPSTMANSDSQNWSNTLNYTYTRHYYPAGTSITVTADQSFDVYLYTPSGGYIIDFPGENRGGYYQVTISPGQNYYAKIVNTSGYASTNATYVVD